jgi:hypothetical protein
VVVGGQEWFHPDVVYNPNLYRFFVVAHTDLPTGPSICGGHVAQGAGPAGLWPIFQGGGAVQPAVAYNPLQGDCFVVWMWWNSTEGAYEIWGRIFKETGLTGSLPFKIYSWANRSFWSPRVAYNAFRNEYFVVWNAYDTSGDPPDVPNDIAGCRVSGPGHVLDCPIIITTEANPHQVDIAYNLVGDRYFVVWVRAYPETSTGHDIYGAVLSWTGVMYTPPGEFAIQSFAAPEDAPAVAADAAGYFVVAWEEEDGSGSRDIRLQEFDNFGATVGAASG